MLLQLVCLISQSVVLGYLTEYFGINEPTYEETRNAYLYAAGKLRMAIFVGLEVGFFFFFWRRGSLLPSNELCLFSNAVINTTINFNTSWITYTGLVVLSVTVVMLHAHAFLIGQKNGMFARIMTTTAIYQKVLNLYNDTIMTVYQCYHYLYIYIMLDRCWG